MKEHELIAEQNDQFRKSWGSHPNVSGKLVLSKGVAKLSGLVRVMIMKSVISFDDFNEENDPYHEHDFGSVKVMIGDVETTFFWKIDLFDESYDWGSEDPACLEATRRVMTIMYPHEY